MVISEFNPVTFPLEIAEKSPLKSEDIRSFTSAAAIDMAALSSLINTYLVGMFDSLPDGSDKLDGSTIYADKDATEDSDNGLLFFNHPSDPNQDRPLTIKEVFLTLLQIMANTENGLREGIKIGSYASKVTVADSGELSYAWPYTDRTFKAMLFYLDGTTVKECPSTVTVVLNTSTSQVVVTNGSGSSMDIWGFIWHPVFTF